MPVNTVQTFKGRQRKAGSLPGTLEESVHRREQWHRHQVVGLPRDSGTMAAQTDVPGVHSSRSKGTGEGGPGECVCGVPGGSRQRRGWQGRLEPGQRGAWFLSYGVCEQRNGTSRIVPHSVYLETFGSVVFAPLWFSQGNFNI